MNCHIDPGVYPYHIFRLRGNQMELIDEYSTPEDARSAIMHYAPGTAQGEDKFFIFYNGIPTGDTYEIVTTTKAVRVN